MASLTGTKQIFDGNTSAVGSTQVNELGVRAWDTSGNEYIYLKGVASAQSGDWIVYDEDFQTTRLVANEVGPVAIAMAAIGNGEYGWYQIYGKNTIARTDTISADKSLYIDGTVGRVDDLGVAGDLVIGAYSMTASSNNIATVYLTYPHVSDDIGGSGGSPTDAQYVVLAANGSLTDERILIGTTNRIIITDGGAGGNVTLNAPQDLHATATVEFGSANIQTLTAGTAIIIGGQITGITDLAVADGGTGASSAAAARTNLGLIIGTDIQAFDAQLSDIATITPSGSAFVGSNATNLILRTAAQTRGDLGLVIGTNVQAYDKDLDDISAAGTAKGNVMVATGTAWVSLLVGSNNQVLTADSTQNLGVKWAASGGGAINQIVTLTNDGTYTSTATTPTEITTNWRLSITPANSNNKLWLKATFVVNDTYTSAAELHLFHFYNVSTGTSIAVGTALGSRTRTSVCWRRQGTDSNDTDLITMEGIITAGTTNAQTFTIYHKRESANNLRISYTDVDSAAVGTYPFTFTITELT